MGIRRFWYLMTLLDQGYQKTKKIRFLELKKNSRIFYSTVKSRFFCHVRPQKKCSNWKILIFRKIPKSDFLALIRRFWYLMTLLDQGYQETKKIGFLELKKNSQFFYCTVKSRFSPILELRKNAQIGKFSFFLKIPNSLILVSYDSTRSGLSENKKIWVLGAQKKFSNFLQYCKITFFANIRAQKKCSNWKILIFRKNS